jgi:hypothetical protein
MECGAAKIPMGEECLANMGSVTIQHMRNLGSHCNSSVENQQWLGSTFLIVRKYITILLLFKSKFSRHWHGNENGYKIKAQGVG